MKKISITFETGTIEDVFSLLHNRLQTNLNTRLEEKVNKSDYPDGITREITYSHSLYNLTPPYKNKITIQERFLIIVYPGKQDKEAAEAVHYSIYDAMIFNGWQTKTPFLEVEYALQWEKLVESIMSELKELFGFIPKIKPPVINQAIESESPEKRKLKKNPLAGSLIAVNGAQELANFTQKLLDDNPLLQPIDGISCDNEGLPLELEIQQADKPAKKSKRGPRNYSRDEKIKAVEQWDNLDRDKNPTTLEEWLDNKFGTTGGVLNVAVSTFHGWRRLKKEKKKS